MATHECQSATRIKTHKVCPKCRLLAGNVPRSRVKRRPVILLCDICLTPTWAHHCSRRYLSRVRCAEDRRRNDTMDIGGWLRGLRLERYEQAFRENEIDLHVLPELTADDLKELGVAIGHRRRLLKAIADLAVGTGRTAAQADSHIHEYSDLRAGHTADFLDREGYPMNAPFSIGGPCLRLSEGPTAAEVLEVSRGRDGMRPTRRRILGLAGALCALAESISSLRAQGTGWPNRPIRIIVPGGPGGVTDIRARWLGDRLGPALGQLIVVETAPVPAETWGLPRRHAARQTATRSSSCTSARWRSIRISMQVQARLRLSDRPGADHAPGGRAASACRAQRRAGAFGRRTAQPGQGQAG